MARKGHGASGGPRGPRRSRPRRRRVWRRPCGSSVKQVGSGRAATRRGGAYPKTRLGAVLAGSAAGKWGRAGKHRMSWQNVPSVPVPASGRGTAGRMPARAWILGNAKGKWFLRYSGREEGARRAPWKLPFSALEPLTVFSAAQSRQSGSSPSWRKCLAPSFLWGAEGRVGAALPTASAASGPRAQQPLPPGILAAKSGTNRLPRSGVVRGAVREAPAELCLSSAGLRFAPLAVVSRHLGGEGERSEKNSGKPCRLTIALDPVSVRLGQS